MVLHLVKLCVGVNSIEDLAAWINSDREAKQKTHSNAEQFHTTRMIPKRSDELLQNGSLYWVIKGNIQCRQKLLDIRPFTDEAGINRCHLVLEPLLVMTQWQSRRAFQGWRYLSAKDAPRDENNLSSNNLPAYLKQELADLGLL